MSFTALLLASLVGGAPGLRAEPPAEILSSPAAAAAARVEAARLLGLALAGEPPIERVQRAAEARAAPTRADAAGWGRRARLAALVPRVTAEYRHDERSYRVLGVSSGAEVDYLRSTPGDSVSVRLGWNLEGLVFGRGELDAAAAAERAEGKRSAAAERATRLYYQRVRLRLALAASPPTTGRSRAEQELELEAVTAELDALTALYGETAP
ncbi:MAG TPA: hypothetical protein VEM76_01435 [Anaeromyxobacteraceae bacterium]|nr:hypothetical protein [Anaeromyxobacteraceae bacterium]